MNHDKVDDRSSLYSQVKVIKGHMDVVLTLSFLKIQLRSGEYDHNQVLQSYLSKLLRFWLS